MNHRDNEEDFIVRNEDIVEDEVRENISDEVEESQEREIISISKEELELPSQEPLIVISREETMQREPVSADWPQQPVVPQGRGITRKLIYALSPVLVLAIGLGVYFGIFWPQPPNGNDEDPEPNIPWLSRIDPAVAAYATELDNNDFDLSQKAELKVVFKVSTDGQEYSIVKYRSSPVGLQVFDAGDSLVTGESIVDKVLASYVWSRHDNRVTAEELAGIQDTYDRVSDLMEQGGPIFEANDNIQELLVYKDWLEGQCIELLIIRGCAWEVICSSISQDFCTLADATEIMSNTLKAIENLLQSVETTYSEILNAQDQLNTQWPSDSTASVVNVNGDVLANDVAKAITSSTALKPEIGDIKTKADEVIKLIDTVIGYIGELKNNPITKGFAQGLINLIKDVRAPVVEVSDGLGAIMTELDDSQTALTQAQSSAQDSENIALEQWEYRP